MIQPSPSVLKTRLTLLEVLPLYAIVSVLISLQRQLGKAFHQKQYSCTGRIASAVMQVPAWFPTIKQQQL